MKKRKILLDKLQAEFEQDLKNGIPGYDCGDTESADDAIEVLHRIIAVAIKTGRRQVFAYVHDHDFELQHKQAERSMHEDRYHKQLVKQLEHLATIVRNRPVQYIKTKECNPQQPGEEVDFGAAHNHPRG